MTDYKEIERLLIGQWHEVLAMYNIDVPKMKGKNSVNYPCPCCGGNDRAHWRETEGRLSLFCRSCAADSMKSPEQVIHEVVGLSFSELVRDLNDYVGGVDEKQFKQAKQRANSKPARNMPVDHKQDHEKSIAFLEGCQDVARHYLFDRFSIQPPGTVKSQSNAVFFDMQNENGAIVNVFALIDNKQNKPQQQFLAGGISYGAWHVVPQCEVRETPGIAWSRSVINAYKHWYKTGQEVRVTFDSLNTIWMMNVGIIKENDLVLDSI
ncbi:DNA primase [Vibrio phage K394]